jgi:hypothetical protein
MHFVELCARRQLFAREVDPPTGVEPIQWMLITDWKVQSLKMARRLIRWYGLRWGIECWHQVLKDVCGVETRQMKSAQALERALVLDMIVAWRAQMLCRLGKESVTLHGDSWSGIQVSLWRTLRGWRSGSWGRASRAVRRAGSVERLFELA